MYIEDPAPLPLQREFHGIYLVPLFFLKKGLSGKRAYQRSCRIVKVCRVSRIIPHL
jgi:hypothetical protein